MLTDAYNMLPYIQDFTLTHFSLLLLDTYVCTYQKPLKAIVNGGVIIITMLAHFLNFLAYIHSWPLDGCGHVPGLLKLFSEKCVCMCVYLPICYVSLYTPM